MAEQTFRSPNFFDREVDLSGPTSSQPSGVPAGIIGTSNKGPAFVPVTVSNFSDFTTTFGNLDPDCPATYAVKQFLDNRNSLTFLRVLGAGANSTIADIQNTQNTGRVKNAGLVLDTKPATGSSSLGWTTGSSGGMFFLVTNERPTVSESYGFPIFNDNDTFPGFDSIHNVTDTKAAQLVRGIMMHPTSSRAMVFPSTVSLVNTMFTGAFNDGGLNSLAPKVSLSSGLSDSNYYFKLVISSSLGSNFASDDGIPGIKVYSASYNPTSPNYIGKILNLDTKKFVERQHLLYADFPVDHEVAVPVSASLLTGSNATGASTLAYSSLFNTMNTRYTTPRTPSFISQPFGSTEHDLFHVEALDDGSYANNLYKVSIANVKVSTDPTNPYGTFSLQIRDWSDNDTKLSVLEQFDNCSLNPSAENYVARLVGDRKVSYNFDADVPEERRLISSGRFENVSKLVRVVMSQNVENKLVPPKSLPFGFRGPQVLKTSDALTAMDTDTTSGVRLANSSGVTSAVIPPIPYRVKVTRGQVAFGQALDTNSQFEYVQPNLYWGAKFERNNMILDVNSVTERNGIFDSLTKFMGIEKLDALVTGSHADNLNNNKFTLARVALSASSLDSVNDSATNHMLKAAYIRNGKVNPNDYTITDTTNSMVTGSVTFASLINATDNSYSTSSNISAAPNFNRFTQFMKFTTFMYGGFDGTNFLDHNAALMNDRASSFDVSVSSGPSGGASQGYVPLGFTSNKSGTERDNSTVNSYTTAVDIMTDPYNVTLNILSIPGIREPYVTDYAGSKTRDYGLALYVMDIPAYDDLGRRIFADSAEKPSIEKTSTMFDFRNIDNDYVATYFPDVFVDDATNRRRVKVPASVAAVSALGFNDKVSYPWFAPAGFNRAALDFVTNVAVRLNVSDRDRLYDSRINPIATFPRQGFVIYGQKTVKAKKSALDRVNVRRLLLEVKRIVSSIAGNAVFEQNTPDVRNKFVADVALQLGLIQVQAGIEAFQVVMNETNNTQDDIDANRLRGRIVVVPTRAIEFIAIDFIVTNSGVQFV